MATDYSTIRERPSELSGNCYTSRATSAFFGKSYYPYLYSTSNEDTNKQFLIINDPAICSGAPSIKGTRISVANIVEMHHILGWDKEKIVAEYPFLTKDQIEAALDYYEKHFDEINQLLLEEKEVDER